MTDDVAPLDESYAWHVAFRLRLDRLPYDAATVRAHVDRSRSGVYAIWRPTFGVAEVRCAYVGMSEKNIRGRLRQHLRKAHNDELSKFLRHYEGMTTFSFEYVDDAAIVRQLEAALIDKLSPDSNIRLTGSP